MSEEKPESATPLEIAMLAAVIDPAACREGNLRDALFRAMALFRESAALCDEMATKSYPEQTEMLMTLFREGNKGAGRLMDVFVRMITDAPVPMLTLAASDDEGDTLRACHAL